MRVSICATTADTNGDLLIDVSESSTFNYLARRVTRIATMDSGSVLIDNGFTPADGNIKLIIDPEKNSLSLYQAIARLITNFSLLTITTVDGVFQGVIESIDNNKTILTVNFLIVKQLA